MATTQKIEATLNRWATLETPPSRFQRYLPEKLKAQLGHTFPFAYPRIGERVNSAFLRALGAEFLGTMFFMFVLVSQFVFSCQPGSTRKCRISLPSDDIYMPIAATAGFTMFVLIYATASFSGGHLNPAITLGALVANKISCMRAVAYMFMQIAGAIVGTSFVWTVESVAPAANRLAKNSRAGPAGGFMVEFMLTFALMFVTLAATDASRYRNVAHLPILAPLAIGMTYFIAHMAATPIDGCSINPARFLGTFALSGVGGWSMWIFFVGPFAGAVAAAFVYEFGFKPNYDEVLDFDGGAVPAAAPAAVGPADPPSKQVATTGQKIKATLNRWATLETPPSRFQRYLPEKLKAQLGHVFPFAYPRIGEPVNSAFLRALGAEFLGTTLFLFILISQIVFSCHIRDAGTCDTKLPDVEFFMPIAATAGFTIFVLVYATASFSGGHLNPAVTLGALVANKISCMRAVAYMFVQIAGAIVGTALVWTVESVAPAANVLSKTGLAGQAGGFMAEFLLTFALMFMVLAATDSARGRIVAHLPVLAPLAIGMVIFCAHMAAIPIDGCSINPARFLATFTLSGVGGWSMWIFFVGPFAGAVAAAFVYEFGFRPDYEDALDLEGAAALPAAAAAPAAVAPPK